MVKREALWDGGPLFYYDENAFPPTTDSFALGYFAAPKRGDAVCDLGCGAGLLGTLLLSRDPSLRLYGVERDEAALRLAERGFAENGWTAELRPGDLRDPLCLPKAGSMDYALCNPPYFARGSGASAPSERRRSAREEASCTLAEVCAAAARVLRWGGRFALVYRPERLTDLLCTLRSAALEPKRLRFVVKSPESAPSLLLLESRRGGRPGLRIEPPLAVGSAEWSRAYFSF